MLCQNTMCRYAVLSRKDKWHNLLLLTGNNR